MKILDILFEKTKHNSYFDKIVFGSKQKFKNMENPTLCLVILTWLWQIQHCFFEKSEQDPLRDWNNYRQYYGTGTGFVSGRATLSNINMSTVKSETRTPVTAVSYFKPNKERDDIITSLEEWAAQLLKPDIKDILKVAKKDSNTKKRFKHAKKPTNFQLTDTNYTTTGNNVCDKNPPTPACPTETVRGTS